MKTECIRDAREEQAALDFLYQGYRNALPPYKQFLVAPSLPTPLLNLPGLICFEAGQPVAGLLWKEYDTGIVVAEFYSEMARASAGSIEHLVRAFLAGTPGARARYFELWTPDNARILSLLPAAGFQCLPKKLLAIEQPVYSPARWNDFRFLPLRNFDLSSAGLRLIAQFLHETYADTSDGAFYDEYGQVNTCQAYLARILDSPLCDLRNSWLAWSPFANKLTGIALCYIWPRPSVLYLEQLAVHPAFRRKGLGRALLSSICSPLADGTIERVLLTIAKDNQAVSQLCQAAKATVLHQEKAFVLKGKQSSETEAMAERMEEVPRTLILPGSMERMPVSSR